MPRPAVGPTHSLIQWVSGDLSQGKLAVPARLDKCLQPDVASKIEQLSMRLAEDGADVAETRRRI